MREVAAPRAAAIRPGSDDAPADLVTGPTLAACEPFSLPSAMDRTIGTKKIHQCGQPSGERDDDDRQRPGDAAATVSAGRSTVRIGLGRPRRSALAWPSAALGLPRGCPGTALQVGTSRPPGRGSGRSVNSGVDLGGGLGAERPAQPLVELVWVSRPRPCARCSNSTALSRSASPIRMRLAGSRHRLSISPVRWARTGRSHPRAQ